MRKTLCVRPPLPGRQEPVEVEQSGAVGLPRSNLLILIHGYNTSVAEAEEAYSRFQQLLRASPGGGFNRAGEVWEFHWPGDHRVTDISMLSYSARVSIATLSGKRLAEYLVQLNCQQTVSIVAHSLGCRVALSAIRDLRETKKYDGPRIGQVFLLAAAVPVPFCTSDAPEFPEPFPESSEHVFYSRRDFTLFAGFPFGQFSFGESGPAVGRSGEPHDRWSTRSDMHIGHSRYWKARHVARAVSAGFRPGWRRELPVQWLPEAGAGVEGQETPVQRLPRSESERRFAA